MVLVFCPHISLFNRLTRRLRSGEIKYFLDGVLLTASCPPGEHSPRRGVLVIAYDVGELTGALMKGLVRCHRLDVFSRKMLI